jgi:hypothetical protein
MDNTVLIGRGKEVERVSADGFRRHVETMAVSPHRFERIAFMTPNDRAIRAWLVAEIARNGGRPVPPRVIAARFKLDEHAVNGILAELEKRLFFLVRNGRGEVSWAFPVTAEKTAHELRFSTGERCHAA